MSLSVKPQKLVIATVFTIIWAIICVRIGVTLYIYVAILVNCDGTADYIPASISISYSHLWDCIYLSSLALVKFTGRYSEYHPVIVITIRIDIGCAILLKKPVYLVSVDITDTIIPGIWSVSCLLTKHIWTGIRLTTNRIRCIRVTGAAPIWKYAFPYNLL